MHRFEGLVSSNLISLVPAHSGKLKLLVALSGGADSVALLCALKSFASLAEGHPYEIYACHVNHGLRGAEADSDQSFCERLCVSKGIPLHVVKLDAIKLDSSEATLRELRYQALAEVAVGLSISHVVTAHTLNDQGETMLFRLCRGTSLQGLAGIKGVRTLEPDLLLLRPLLSIGRLVVEAYLADIEQSWCVDFSNADDKYSRNFLRNQIIPQLNQRFSTLSQNLEHLRLNIERENDLLDLLAAEQLESLRQPGRCAQSISVEAWQKLHPALRARVLVKLMRESGVEASFDRVERVAQIMPGISLGQGGPARHYSLGNGLEILLEGGGLSFSAEIEAVKQSKGDELSRLRRSMLALAVRLPVVGRSTALTLIPWLDKALRIEVVASSSDSLNFDGSNSDVQYPHRRAHHCLVDLGRVTGDLTFRLRQEGDRIQPLGMDESVRLKHYLHANKDKEGNISLLKHLDEPMAQRLTPVLADEQEVLWVPGYGLSQKVKVGKVASHRLSLIDLASDSGKTDSSFC
ncbi:tRNA lysidine(34) synthetase TilS [bacterium]|nr:tRNA lysidine(34) synthetase TilS [bacterium]MBP9810665.1 tRNA lysidine(34) synthetase TilS [bacterium]